MGKKVEREQDEAAILIQSRARGKAQSNEKKAVRDKRNKAATIIQKKHRGNADRERIKPKIAAARQQKETQTASAIRIQSNQWGRMVRKELANKQLAEEARKQEK